MAESRIVPNTRARGEKYSPLSHAWYCRSCTLWHPMSMARHMRDGNQLCDRGAYDYDMLRATLERMKDELV